MKTYHELQAEKAYNAFAAGFVQRTKEKYRQCTTEEDLRILSKQCWKEHDSAWRTISRNGYENMTRHGTMPYDRYSALAMEAENYAKQLYKKAELLKAGALAEDVLPHLKSVPQSNAA